MTTDRLGFAYASRTHSMNCWWGGWVSIDIFVVNLDRSQRVSEKGVEKLPMRSMLVITEKTMEQGFQLNIYEVAQFQSAGIVSHPLCTYDGYRIFSQA